MALAPGTKLGPYEIVAPLGAGGMGEVYRARDTRLDRDVAVKVLPADLSSDPNLRQRLEREAKAVSKLSHPNICTLNDVGQHDGIDYLVMELVEGETLEQRLTKGPLPTEQTIRYSTQIADALAKAHRLGVTHRDLKPSNIMLTKMGAKLMDFGLAKQSGPSPLATALTEMTVEQQKLTSQGMLVGTFQYMAPEQLEGKDADTRTDLFALGEVIYEMATGKPAFSGKSRATLIAAILTTDPPPITKVQPLTPPALERVVRKCLSKDPEDRWQSASDLATELNWIAEGGLQPGTPVPVTLKWKTRERLAWAVAMAGLLVASLAGAAYYHEASKPAQVVRAVIPTEEGTSPVMAGDLGGPVVLSPDGKTLAFGATDTQGKVTLWVRDLDGLHARSLAGTDGATMPFWSPDGRSLAYFAGGKLKTVPVEGGTPADICDAPAGRGGTWNAQGTILFSPQYESAIYQVSASGGAATPVTTVDNAKHDSHRWPYFLPDGRHFLYLAVNRMVGREPNDAIYFASLDGKENRLLMHAFANAAYGAGRLLFMRGDALMAQSLDPDTGKLTGEPTRIAQDIGVDPTIWRAAFDVARSNILVYAAGGSLGGQAVWFDSSGKELGIVVDKALNLYHVRISPDGQKVATDFGETTTSVWVYDLRRKVNTRLTLDQEANVDAPVWSPDGRWIVYHGLQNGHNNIYRKAAGGFGERDRLLEGASVNQVPSDWSPDGKSLLFSSGDLAGQGQVWMLPLNGDHKPVPIAQNGNVSKDARFSPDGRWIAYASDASGKFEVYVIPSDRTSGRWQISSAGGLQPVWRRDGKEIFYLALDNALMSVPITLSKDVVEVGAVRQLFRVPRLVGTTGNFNAYDVTPDGQRFLTLEATQSTPPTINGGHQLDRGAREMTRPSGTGLSSQCLINA
jgi:eukaryotic-like serine/threonine-protein kinase